nr:hypothetical protein BaRGS_015732 [Batillaria attramentaria]
MSVRVFENIPNVLEVQCSGEILDSSSDLLMLTLYSTLYSTSESRQILASVNLRTEKCVSSQLFASCHLNTRDPKKTKLKVLVADLAEGELRSYGCTAGVPFLAKHAGKRQWKVSGTTR